MLEAKFIALSVLMFAHDAAGLEGIVDNSDHLAASFLQCRSFAGACLLHVLLRGSAHLWQHPAAGSHHQPCQL